MVNEVAPGELIAIGWLEDESREQVIQSDDGGASWTVAPTGISDLVDTWSVSIKEDAAFGFGSANGEATVFRYAAPGGDGWELGPLDAQRSTCLVRR